MFPMAAPQGSPVIAYSYDLLLVFLFVCLYYNKSCKSKKRKKTKKNMENVSNNTNSNFSLDVVPKNAVNSQFETGLSKTLFH